MDRTLNLKQLKYFLETASQGSFSKASAVLGIDQPSLSRNVKSLEEEVGDYLLYRNGRGVQLTALGTDLLNISKDFLEAVEGLQVRARLSGEELSGRVVFGAVLGLSDMFAPAILMKFKEQFPNVQIHVVGGNSGFIQEWLLEGRIDLGLIYDTGRSQDLVAETCLVESMVVVGTKELASKHGVETNGLMNLADLAGLPLTLASRHHGLRRAVDQCASQQNVQLNIAYEVDNIVMSKGLVRLGACFAILPAGGVLDLIDDKDIFVAEFIKPQLQLAFSLAYARNRPFPAAARELARMIRMESGAFGEKIESRLADRRRHPKAEIGMPVHFESKDGAVL